MKYFNKLQKYYKTVAIIWFISIFHITTSYAGTVYCIFSDAAGGVKSYTGDVSITRSETLYMIRNKDGITVVPVQKCIGQISEHEAQE